MTAPEPRPSGADGNARGLLVLAAAVVVGFLLLWNLGGGSTSSADTKDESSTPNTTAPLDGTTTEATTTTLASGSGHTASVASMVVGLVTVPNHRSATAHATRPSPTASAT